MRFFTNSGMRFRTITFLFLLKIIAGVGLTLVYTYYYTDRSTSDIYKYFDDGKVVYNVLKEDPIAYLKLVSGVGANDTTLLPYLDDTKNWHEQSADWLNLMSVKNTNYFNSNRLVTRFNAMVMLFSQGYIYVHVVFMCFLALLGSIGLYRALMAFYKEKENILLAIIFLLPAVLFWQSGVLKEGLLIFFTGLFIFHFFAFFQTKDWVNAVCALLFFFFIVLCKYYVAVAMLPGIVAYKWQGLTGGRNASYKFAYTFIGIMLAVVIALYALPQYNPLNTLTDKRSEAIKSAIFGEANELLFTDNVAPYPADVAKKLPELVRITFFEPIKITAKPMIALASFENVLVLVLVLLFIFKANNKLKNPAVFWFLLSYSLIILFIIAFTTPVTGGLVRYKTAGIPFLLIALLMLSNNKWVYRINTAAAGLTFFFRKRK